MNPREGNHGEDVKESYFYLDNTPTHSYMKMLYKYPQRNFHIYSSSRKSKTKSDAAEYELLDTGIFQENHYFDIEIAYAKAGPEDILISSDCNQIKAPDPAPLHILPTLWFRNTWSWGYERVR